MAHLPVPSDGGSSSPPDAASWRATAWRVGRGLLAVLASGTATYLGGCMALLGVYSAVVPPVTGVQLQRSVEAWAAGAPTERTYAPMPLARMSPALPLAVVAGEDSRFFEHNGIDWEAVGEAIEDYRTEGRLRGGSTITQQLVKNLFLTTHSTVLRKALEVPLTYGAELLLTKRRILELYLNVIEWGPGVYGAEAAAQYHYGFSARHLSRSQAAALAACIPAPRTRHPRSVGRYQHIILQRMSVIGRLPLSTLAPTAPSPTTPRPIFSLHDRPAK